MEHIRWSKRSRNAVYRRRVPLDVVEAFGRAWVEQSLGTSDPREVRRRAAILTAKLEETWAVMRGETSPLQQWRRDIGWLAEQKPFRVQVPGGDKNDEEELTPIFASEMMEQLAEGQIKPPPGVREETYAAWLAGEKSIPKPKVALNDALRLWLDERKPTASAERTATREVDRFEKLSGIVALDQITRRHARKYRDTLRASGASPGSVITYLSYLRAVYDAAIKEGLTEERANPFSALKVERDKTQEEDQEPIPRDACLAILQQALARGYDQADWFAAILLTTGMRPIEAYRARLVLDGAVPYWDVPRAKKSPPRKVPLHPLLFGKEPVPFSVRAEQLRRQFIQRFKPYTAYQSRHAWKDEALKVEMPIELRMRLMGHSVRKVVGVHAIYGSASVNLLQAKGWIEKMWEHSETREALGN